MEQNVSTDYKLLIYCWMKLEKNLSSEKKNKLGSDIYDYILS